MTEYIELEKIEKFFDGIYDCADLVFEPNDHCCASDDCGHCKWYEAKEAIRKRILSIPAADVREVKRGKWEVSRTDYGWNGAEFPTHCKCTECGREVPYQDKDNFCPNCGADMR